MSLVGATGPRIPSRHLLPHAAGPIIVKASLTVGTAVLAESALSLLGLGIGAPDTSLGRLVETGQHSASTRPWLFYFPDLVSLVIVLCVNFVGDGLRDALDPTSKRHARRIKADAPDAGGSARRANETAPLGPAVAL